MTFAGHIGGAYITLQLANAFNPTLRLDQPTVLIGIIGGAIPDIDSFFYKQIKDHHDSPLHTPFVWASFFLFLLGVNYFLNMGLQLYIFALLIGVFSHIFLDWYAGRIAGVRIFYPFSKKRYSLFPMNPDQGKVPLKAVFTKEYIKFYSKNRFLLISEIFIVLAAIALVFIKN